MLSKRAARAGEIAALGFFITVIAAARAGYCDAQADPADFRFFFEENPPPRKALVIGVKDYTNLQPVPSAITDTSIVDHQLVELGFDTKVVPNPDASHLWGELRGFQASLSAGDVALFYFSGHGFQWEGMNYLAPSDAPRVVNQSDISLLNIPLANVIQRLREQSVGYSVLIIDACRTNSLSVDAGEGVEKGAPPRGFAQVQAPPQLVIGFAASFGQVALSSSGEDESSIYTRHLVNHFDRPGRDISKIFKEVALDVFHAAPSQTPEFRATVAGNFYPNPDEKTLEFERQTWRAVLDRADPGLVRKFLLEWPAGRFAASARRWLSSNKSFSPAASGIQRLEVLRSRGVGPSLTSRDRIAQWRGEAVAFPPIRVATETVAGTPVVVGSVRAEELTVFAEPSLEAGRLRQLSAGEAVYLAEPEGSMSSEDTAVSAEGLEWYRVVLEPDSERQEYGWIPEALDRAVEPRRNYDIHRILLLSASKTDFTEDSVRIRSIDSSLEDALERWKEVRAGASAPATLANVALGKTVDGAQSALEERQLTFLRSLRIRQLLLDAGLLDANISINPEKADVEEQSEVAGYDIISLYTPRSRRR